jgi:hypothetical protein
MTSSDKPKQFTGNQKCGHCGNTGPMEIASCYSQVEEREDDQNNFTWECGDVYEILLCPACRRIILRTYFYQEGMEGEDIAPDILYPISKGTLLGLPNKVEKAYTAALKVRSIDVNAYGVLIGRVLEIVCEDRSAKGKNLNEKLKDLSDKGEIPIKLVDVAASLRQLRNVGAHATLGELTEKEIPLLDDLCRAILEYVYSAPYLVQKAEERLSQLKENKK